MVKVHSSILASYVVIKHVVLLVGESHKHYLDVQPGKSLLAPSPFPLFPAGGTC